MAFWSSDTLKVRIQADQLIIPYRSERVKHGAYEMGVGGEAFVTSKSADGPRLSAGAQVEIPPGQFGLLVTAEVVTVPANAIGFISIRARIKFLGLMNVSGFHVDPGFKGQLKFAVYNAGSQTIRLDQDQPIFMIWFCDLDKPTEDPYENPPPAQNVITAMDASKLQGEVASPAELKKQIEELRRELEKKTHAIQADIDKKFHTVEQSRLYNRSLIMLALGAVVSLALTVIGWTVIKPMFDRPAEKQVAGVTLDSTAEPRKDNRLVAEGVDRDRTLPPLEKATPTRNGEAKEAAAGTVELTPDSRR